MIWGMRWLLFVQVVPSRWPIVWLRGGRCKANNCITFILCRTLDFWHCSTAAAAGLHQDTGSCSINVRGCNHCRLQAAGCMLHATVSTRDGDACVIVECNWCVMRGCITTIALALTLVTKFESVLSPSIKLRHIVYRERYFKISKKPILA